MRFIKAFDPSLWKRIVHKDKIHWSLGDHVDIWFEDGLRTGLLTFGELTKSTLARVISKERQVLYENEQAIVEWNIRSGMVSVLYPAEEILRNFGVR